MRILVTGGAGYLGSHTVVLLIERGYDVIIVDDFRNSNPEILQRIHAITGVLPTCFNVNVQNKEELRHLFEKNRLDAVLHFAGSKAVGESIENPRAYYANNLCSTINIVDLMIEFNVANLILSSSATVYGYPKSLPIKEDSPYNCVNPYGRTKMINELFLKDVVSSGEKLSVAILRYFNPVGAHPSGMIGEDPEEPINNLMPLLTQVASGKRDKLLVFGSDYATIDGTGVRDYIHVIDLAEGHIAALRFLFERREAVCETINLGRGEGYSVLQLIRQFELASGAKVSYELVDRREGDVDICYADVSKARQVLGWIAEKDIRIMCEDSWRWQSMNPNGYNG